VRVVDGAVADASDPLVRLLFIGLAVAVVVFLASNGHVVFLPLLLFLPLGLLGHRSRRKNRR